MRVSSLVCVPVLALSALLGVGCNSKVEECNKLIGAMNTEGGKLNVKGSDPAALNKMADDLDASAKAIGGIELTIPELVQYREGAKKVFTDVAGGARASAQAMETKDITKVAGAMKALGESAKANTKLVGELNSFCQGK